MKKMILKYIILLVTFMSVILVFNFSIKNMNAKANDEVSIGETIEIAGITPQSTDINLVFTNNTTYNVVKYSLRDYMITTDDGSKMITISLEEAMKIESIYINSYSFGDVSGLVVLNELPNLKSLTFHYCSLLTNLDSLSALTNIEELILNYNGVTDISFLTSMPNLKKLSLVSERKINDLGVLENLTNLETIKLTGLYLTDIPKLPAIKELDLSSNSISDFTQLNQYPSLEVVNLDFNQIASIPDASDLSNLTSLKNLNLDNNRLTGIRSMEAFPNLEVLSIFRNEITSISNISNMLNLKELKVGSSYINDYETLTNLPSLTKLEIYYSNLKEIPSNILSFTTLEELNIYSSKISDISNIIALTNLKKLELTTSEIEDISVIGSLTNLEYLDISDNIIKDITPLYHLPNLKFLDVGYNRVSDLNDLFLQDGALNKVEDLILENNIISDMTEIDNLVSKDSLANLNWLSLRGNQISKIDGIENVTNVEYDLSFQEHTVYLDDLSDYTLPSWVGKIKDPTNTVYYLSGGHICNGCTLSADNKTVSFDPDYSWTHSLVLGYYMGTGYLTDATISFKVDKNAPTYLVSYEENGTTSNIVTINFSEDMKETSGWTLLNNESSFKKEYFTNVDETITFSDKAGNTVDVNIVVSNIKKPQVLQKKYDHVDTTANNVSITFDKEMNTVAGWDLSSDKKTFTKKFTDNFTNNIEFSDIYGNKVLVAVEVSNIEDLKVINQKYNALNSTKNTVTITFNKPMEQISGWTLSADLKTLTKTFFKNYNGNIMFVDIYGNTIFESIVISNIKMENNSQENENEIPGSNVEFPNEPDDNIDIPDEPGDNLDTDDENDDAPTDSNNGDENQETEKGSSIVLIGIIIAGIVILIIFLVRRNKKD